MESNSTSPQAINLNSNSNINKYFRLLLRLCLKNQQVLLMARFILETDDPSGRTWARKNSSSNNRTVYKRGQADGSSVKTNYLRSSSVQTDLLA